jgi:P-type Ca2+ transporter type 2C
MFRYSSHIPERSNLNMLTTQKKNNNNYWTLSNDQVALSLGINTTIGHNKEEAAAILSKDGNNTIILRKEKSPLHVLISQFASPIIWLLMFSTGLSFFLGEWLDGVAIGIVIIINAAIGFIMEMQARRSMHALMKMTVVTSMVLRDGQVSSVKSENIVRGDVLFLEGGDMVTADARLIKVSQLEVDESVLTGESLPVFKVTKALPANTPMAERTNMVYKGSFITKGNGFAVVVNTGMSTELGTIADISNKAIHTVTSLEKKIEQLSKKLIWITLILVLLVFIAGLLYKHGWIIMLKTAVALAVASIPEGMPVVTTLALAYGMLLMAKHGVIVKKMSSIETLGGISAICTDKTGTLTQNKIEVAHVHTAGKDADVKVNVPAANLSWKQDLTIADTGAFKQLCKISALCNTANFRFENGVEIESGDPLETALLKMVYCTPLKPVDYRLMFPLAATIPFSSETRIMATLHKDSDQYYIAVKGSIEDVLGYCKTEYQESGINLLTDGKKQQWLKIAEKHAAAGLRLLAFAFSSVPEKKTDLLQNLTLAGYIAFIDPPRPEVAQSVQLCREAGIRVVMITGDHPATAMNIALQLGIASRHDKVMSGKMMHPYAQLNAADKQKWLETNVFARVSPEQKLDLVKIYQEHSLTVAMIGDGVNDAPAIKKADIGIAMGKGGTQVAQDVADMVLKNNSFSSVVLAVRQGRIIFDNIRKFVIYLLSSNLSELFVIGTVTAANLPFQLIPLQILFINLITDLLPALALGITKGAPDIMQQKPHKTGTPILDKKRWIAIITYAFIIAAIAMSAVWVAHVFLPSKKGIDNNILFYTLIFSQLFHVFNMSFDSNLPFFKTEIFRNIYAWYAVASCTVISLICIWIKPVRTTLGIVIDDWKEWMIVLSFSLFSVILIRIFKKLKWLI